MKNKLLNISISNKDAVAEFRGKSLNGNLYNSSILEIIDKVVGDINKVSGIKVEFANAPFSITRQVVTTVNTIAWALGIKVNGKKRIKAEYDREPNITL